MSTSSPPTPISTDLLCLKCHYNLRTLSPDSKCPECGTPVQQSLEVFRLLALVPFRRLALAAAGLALLAFLGTYRILEDDWVFDDYLQWIHALAFPPLLLFATFLLTTSRPPHLRRRSTRLALLAAFVFSVSAGVLFTTLLWSYAHGTSASITLITEYHVLFVPLGAFRVIFELPFQDFWQWIVPLLYLLFLFLLASCARFFYSLLRQLDYPRLAKATLLPFSLSFILPVTDLLEMALWCAVDHVAIIARHKAELGTVLTFLHQNLYWRYLSFYVPASFVWLMLSIIFLRLHRRHGSPHPSVLT